MNQWIERIQQFLPNARVGKIQGPIIDIDDKDIVMAAVKKDGYAYNYVSERLKDD